MAVDFKPIIADAFLKLCETKSISKITINDVLDATGCSRQAFYNHFHDKQDLIQYIYLERIIGDFKTMSEDRDFDYYTSLIGSFNNYQHYYEFMKQSLMISGQNCLHDFMIDHCIEIDTAWHKLHYGGDMPFELLLATRYNAIASMEMAITWILSGMPSEPESVVKCIINMRQACLSPLLNFYDGSASPYDVAASKARSVE